MLPSLGLVLRNLGPLCLGLQNLRPLCRSWTALVLHSLPTGTPPTVSDFAHGSPGRLCARHRCGQVPGLDEGEWQGRGGQGGRGPRLRGDRWEDKGGDGSAGRTGEGGTWSWPWLALINRLTLASLISPAEHRLAVLPVRVPPRTAAVLPVMGRPSGCGARCSAGGVRPRCGWQRTCVWEGEGDFPICVAWLANIQIR